MSIEMQRTYAIVGTCGCGKTSLAELLLLRAGVTTRLGSIEDGTTCLDYEPEEIRRRGSVQPAMATYLWNKNRHFMLDIPGDNNFIGDLPCLLQAVDAAVFVLDAVDGVRPLTQKFWTSLQDAGLPRLIFISKMDRSRADYGMAYSSLSALPGIKPVAMYLPIMNGETFAGVVDILENKAYPLDGSGNVQAGTVPEDMADEVALLRDVAVENIAESDDALMEKYLEEGTLSSQDIRLGLRKGVLSGQLTPVLMGSSLNSAGGAKLLDAIEQLFPSPLERTPFLGADGTSLVPSTDGPAITYVFKTLTDPFTGQLSLMRVLSGTVSSESTLQNLASGEAERLSSLGLLCGKTSTQTKEAFGPGALVAVGKLKNTHTGDSLCEEKASFVLPKPVLPPQLITFALAPKNKGDEDKVFAAMQKLLDEDITLKLGRDEESGDTLLSGMGQLHIELAVEKAMRRSKTEFVLKTPKVPYRETVRGKCQVQGRHKKQSGGRGQFGDCWIEMEGMPRGSGYVFEDAIVGGAVPRSYIPAIDKGIQEAAARGFLAGYPVVDFKVRLYDGSYHPVDSSEMAFKVAGSLAFKKAMESLKPVLLEPVVLLSITIPDESIGDVIGDLSSRRGKVLGSDSQGGVTEIKAHVPMSEVLRYAPQLRSLTAGQGIFTMEFAYYEEAPQPVVEAMVAEYQAQREEG